MMRGSRYPSLASSLPGGGKAGASPRAPKSAEVADDFAGGVGAACAGQAIAGMRA